MKFLLVGINSKYIHSNLAIRLLKGYALKSSPFLSEENIELHESTINNNPDEVLTDIISKNPDAVGFSCYIWNIEFIKALSGRLHEKLPDVHIWLGGPEVSFDAEEILKEYSHIRGIMTGEGEAVFTELVKSYVDGKPLEGILRGSEIPMDDVAFPYSKDNIKEFENKIIYYESQRGCPFKCSYCLSSVTNGLRVRSAEMVKAELKVFIDAKVKQVKFTDRTFNADKKYCKEIWQWILENDNGLTNFHFEIAGDILDDEEISILSKMRPGLVQLEIGVQSTNPETIKEIRRVMNLNKLSENVAKVKAGRNVHQHLDLIAGLPYEDIESFEKSFNDVYFMEPDQLQLGFLKVLKGSYMASRVNDYEIEYSSLAPYEVLSTKWLSKEDVETLKKVEEMVELFYNTHQFETTIKIIEEKYDSTYKMFLDLAVFYEKKNLELRNPARMYRYKAILDFVSENYPERTNDIKQSLTLDYYLREKAKSRPGFAKDLKDSEAIIRDITNSWPHRQVHVDVFDSSKVLELSGLLAMKDDNGQVFTLFDYAERDPLTNNAKIYEISYLQWENDLL